MRAYVTLLRAAPSERSTFARMPDDIGPPLAALQEFATSFATRVADEVLATKNYGKLISLRLRKVVNGKLSDDDDDEKEIDKCESISDFAL